jgi:gas vesicle protein
MTTMNKVAGVGLVAATGALFALLFAPATGRETRRRIRAFMTSTCCAGQAEKGLQPARRDTAEPPHDRAEEDHASADYIGVLAG